MESEKGMDYQLACLADLEAKRAALDTAISGLRAWIAMQNGEVPPPVDVGSATTAGSTRTDLHLQGDSFFGMSIPEAAIKYLKLVRKPQSVPEICSALERGGLQSTAKDFKLITYGILGRREREKGDIVKVKRGQYGLAEWYPGLKGKRTKEANDTTGEDKE